MSNFSTEKKIQCMLKMVWTVLLLLIRNPKNNGIFDRVALTVGNESVYEVLLSLTRPPTGNLKNTDRLQG